MDYGPVDFIKEGAKSILGKRVSQGLLHDTKKEEEGYARKCGKYGDDSHSDETTGVFEHPCRAQ